MALSYSVCLHPEQLPRVAADYIESAIWTALGRRPGQHVRVALSGGTTPYQTLGLLRHCELPWHRITWLWVDERFVEADHERSNVGMAERALFGHVVNFPRSSLLVPPPPSQVDGSLQRAADEYDATVQASIQGHGRLDLVLLGIGEDGHTASLFPGAPELEERERAVVAVAPREGREPRLSLTRTVLENAHSTLLLAQGAGKQQAFAALRDDRTTASVIATPARLLHSAIGTVHCITDAAALGVTAPA
jgi:6-phosphogluconolactonase